MAGIRKRIKLWHVAVAIPVVCGLGGWIATTIAERNARAEVEREAAKLKALGIPVQPDELARNVAPEQNAAPIYQRAILLSPTLGKAEIQGFRSTGVKPEELEKYRRYVHDQAPTLELIKLAAAKPACEWNRNWALGPNLLLPEFAQFKSFGKLAAARAFLEAEKGNYGASMEWLQVGRRIAFHSREPVLIGTLVSIAIESIMLREFQSQLSEHGSDPTFRSAAAKYLKDMGDLPSVREGLKGEVILVRTTMKMIGENQKVMEAYGFNGESDAKTKAALYALRFPFVRAAIEAKGLRRYREVFEAIGEGGYKKEEEATANLDTTLSSDQSWLGQLLNIFYPVFSQAGQAVTKLEANRKVSQAGLAIWEARAKLGAFPKEFAASFDPFTEKPLVYKKTPTGFKLYSMGPNKTDDGGLAKPGKSRTDDIELYWPTP